MLFTSEAAALTRFRGAILGALEATVAEAAGRPARAREPVLACVTPGADIVRVDLFIAFSTAPWTYPAIASMMTGLPPRRHGGEGIDREAVDMRRSVPTLGEILGWSGYQAHAVVPTGAPPAACGPSAHAWG